METGRATDLRGPILNKPEEKTLLWILATVLVIMLLFGVFAPIPSDDPDDDPPAVSNMTGGRELPVLPVAIWISEECNSEDEVMDLGGEMLKVLSSDISRARIEFFCIQEPPASRVAVIETIARVIASDGKSLKAAFFYSNDGWDNRGYGSIMLMKNGDVIVDNTETSNSGDNWGVGSGSSVLHMVEK